MFLCLSASAVEEAQTAAASYLTPPPSPNHGKPLCIKPCLRTHKIRHTPEQQQQKTCDKVGHDLRLNATFFFGAVEILPCWQSDLHHRGWMFQIKVLSKMCWCLHCFREGDKKLEAVWLKSEEADSQFGDNFGENLIQQKRHRTFPDQLQHLLCHAQANPHREALCSFFFQLLNWFLPLSASSYPKNPFSTGAYLQI